MTTAVAWNCAFCTYENITNNDKCAICDKRRASQSQLNNLESLLKTNGLNELVTKLSNQNVEIKLEYLLELCADANSYRAIMCDHFHLDFSDSQRLFQILSEYKQQHTMPFHVNKPKMNEAMDGNDDHIPMDMEDNDDDDEDEEKFIIEPISQTHNQPIKINMNHEMDIKYDDSLDTENLVLPLIMPNNCHYDTKSKKLVHDKSQPRKSLEIYYPALEFIRSINEKIAVISIVGPARTGKSLIAGQLFAPNQPCPFDLGHKLDPCTFGIWIGIKKIKHPIHDNVVVLILDVEGTGSPSANEQQDMQLMVMSLLISSYFIYNSKGAFNSTALDQIEFVTELTDRIQTTNNEDCDEDHFRKYFPNFLWLLRDCHLEPVIEDKKVSVREYFTKEVLKFQTGMSRKIGRRQNIRSAFLQMFQQYDAFTLPMPTSKKTSLQNLETISRSELEPAFNETLDRLCKKVLTECGAKALYNEEHNFVQCNGAMLAKYIELCLQNVNKSEKIPPLGSTTLAVMLYIFNENKTNAIKQYQTLLQQQINGKKGYIAEPLEKKDIINIHLDVLQTVLKNQDTLRIAFQDQTNDINRQQYRILLAFYEDIGHNEDISKIGETGFLAEELRHNEELSIKQCNEFIHQQYKWNIEYKLDDPETYTVKQVIDDLSELQKQYDLSCKGPSKASVWKAFTENTMKKRVDSFKKLRAINNELLIAQKEQEEERLNTDAMKNILLEQKQETEQQNKMHQNAVERLQERHKNEEMEHKKNLQDLQNKINDFKNCSPDLENKLKKQLDEANKLMGEQQKRNEEHMEQMRRDQEEIKRQLRQKQQVQKIYVKRKPKSVWKQIGGFLGF